jgi:Ca2+ transporting ATPase
MKSFLKEGIDLMAGKALRTLGFCYKTLDPESISLEKIDEQGVYEFEKDNFVLLGFCGIKDIIKPEVPESVIKCHKAGINVKMVTGDNKLTAKAVAAEVNIINAFNEKSAIIMEGPEFMRLVGGLTCDNCRDKDSCDCVLKEEDLEKPENKDKQVRKEAIKNKQEFRRIRASGGTPGRESRGCRHRRRHKRRPGIKQGEHWVLHEYNRNANCKKGRGHTDHGR